VVCKKEAPIYWINVAISPTGKAAALVDREGYMWGGTPDFKVRWRRGVGLWRGGVMKEGRRRCGVMEGEENVKGEGGVGLGIGA